MQKISGRKAAGFNTNIGSSCYTFIRGEKSIRITELFSVAAADDMINGCLMLPENITEEKSMFYTDS
jgi:hypothetical protein